MTIRSTLSSKKTKKGKKFTIRGPENIVKLQKNEGGGHSDQLYKI